MPTYDFRCQECGCYFKKSMSLRERDVSPACGECDSRKTERVFVTVPYIAGQPGGDSCGSCSATPSRCRSCGS